MKRIFGYLILGAIASGAQTAVVRIGMVGHDWFPLMFEGIIALGAFGLWLVSS